MRLRFRNHRGWGLPVLFCLMIGISATTIASPKPQVLIIDLPRFTYAQLSKDTPHLLQLAENSAAGIMTTPFADPLTAGEVYLGMNSGTQLKTYDDSILFYNSFDKYRDLPVATVCRGLYGYTPPIKGGVNLGLAKLMQQNGGAGSALAASIGLFGKVLHSRSLKTAVIGNADSDLPNRAGAGLLMDERGTVDFAAVGAETLVTDRGFPYGIRTDTRQVMTLLREAKKQTDVIQLSLGDLERLERFNVYLSEARWHHLRRLALASYDRLLGEIMAETSPNTLVVIFSSLPPAKRLEIGARLTPVLITGPGFERGILFSWSTRRAGIITCYDLPATILSFLGINPEGHFNGHKLETRPGDWRGLAGKLPQLIKNFGLRWPLLTTYGYLLIVIVLLAILGLIFYPRITALFRIVEYGYLFLLTVPVVFLVEALFNPLSWPAIIGLTVGLGGLLLAVSLGLARGRRQEAVALIGLFTVIWIGIDGLFNGVFELNAFLGYSAVAGARFYGIGNEYMGFLLGAYITMISISFEKLRRFPAQVLWLAVFLITVFLVHPNFGANIGGGITALIGLGITTYLWLERPIHLRELAGLLGAMLAMLILVGIWELAFSGDKITHFGQLISLIKLNGFQAVSTVLIRKWQMGMRLIGYTPWAKVLLAILVAIPLLYKKPPTVLARLIKNHPGIMRGILGLTFTALIALVVNDSGIVAVATMFIFGAFMLLQVIFEEWVYKDEPCASERRFTQ